MMWFDAKQHIQLIALAVDLPIAMMFVSECMYNDAATNDVCFRVHVQRRSNK